MRIDLYEGDMEYMREGNIAMIEGEAGLMVITLEGLQNIVNQVARGMNILITHDGNKTLVVPQIERDQYALGHVIRIAHDD